MSWLGMQAAGAAGAIQLNAQPRAASTVTRRSQSSASGRSGSRSGGAGNAAVDVSWVRRATEVEILAGRSAIRPFQPAALLPWVADMPACGMIAQCGDVMDAAAIQWVLQRWYGCSWQALTGRFYRHLCLFC